MIFEHFGVCVYVHDL